MQGSRFTTMVVADADTVEALVEEESKASSVGGGGRDSSSLASALWPVLDAWERAERKGGQRDELRRLLAQQVGLEVFC
jgi:hypothetical protein